MNYALYQVSVKLQLMDGDKLLVLTTPDNFIDFPGGRIDESEQGLTMEQALAREVREELGDSLQYKVVDTAFVAHRDYSRQGKTQHVLVVHFRAKLTSGTIKLSEEHIDYHWVEPASLVNQQDRFISSDEYRRLATYYA